MVSEMVTAKRGALELYASSGSKGSPSRSISNKANRRRSPLR